VVFVDTVGSTPIATSLGDQRWQALLRRELAILRKLLKGRGGLEVDTAGDGLFALFNEPAPAVRFAAAACEAVRTIGLEIRAGVHFGEVEFSDGRPGGIVVHTGARTMSVGGAGEVLVTQGVRDLLTGGGLGFDEHGTHQLKGIEGTWAISRLTKVDETPVEAPLDEYEAAQRRRDASDPTGSGGRRPRGRMVAIAVTVIVVAVVIAIVSRSKPEERVRSAAQGPPVNSLLRVDPATGKAEKVIGGLETLIDKNWISTLDIGEGGVWYLDSQLHHIDPTDGREIGVHPLPESRISAMVIGAREVWVASRRELLKIDPADDEELGRTPLDTATGIGPTAIAVGGGSVWMAWDDGSVSRFGRDGELRQSIDAAELASDILFAAERVWVADPFAGELIVLDPTTGTVVNRIDVGGSPTALTSQDDEIIWVMDQAGSVKAVDAATHDQGDEIQVGPRPVDIAASEDAIWVVDGEDELLRRIDVATHVVTAFPMGAPLGTLAVEEETGLIWVRTTREGHG
jgi:outer membrane protein assembly factor BamB